MDIQLHRDSTFIEEFDQALDNDSSFCSWDLFQLAYLSAKATINPDFKGLTAPKHLPHMHFLSHQLECAQQIVEEMNGRGLLADEVGLGKTIEAGLI